MPSHGYSHNLLALGILERYKAREEGRGRKGDYRGIDGVG